MWRRAAGGKTPVGGGGGGGGGRRGGLGAVSRRLREQVGASTFERAVVRAISRRWAVLQFSWHQAFDAVALDSAPAVGGFRILRRLFNGRGPAVCGGRRGMRRVVEFVS